MKLFKLHHGIGIERKQRVYILEHEGWDEFVNDDNLAGKIRDVVHALKPVEGGREMILTSLEAPIQSQELWASGVTYKRSKVGRQEESKNAGGGDFYARAYEAERPELFFKSTKHRIVGHGEFVRIRKDSVWNVPEPELTLMITSSASIVGYTIGNDMSSRSIEGENPLYLPQAKTYDGCASLGPCIYVPEGEAPKDILIQMEVARKGAKVFEGSVSFAHMTRTPEKLVSFLYRECTFPHGSLLMTGTGIVPTSDFTLEIGDRIQITIEPIGTLENTVV